MSGELEAAKRLPLRQVPSVKQLLINDHARDQLAAVAAKHMNPERMMRVVANAIRVTPKLQDCEPISFLGALMQCAALGLEPNTVLGHAYLIPFENSRKVGGQWVKVKEVQVIIGYKGLIDLARRSGHITSISANVHYSDDELWEYEEGTEAKLRHRPGPQEGKKLHAYAIAQFRDGGHAYVVLPWKVVMKTRDGSQNWQSAVKLGKTDKAPWKTHEDAMAMKTAIRALSKYLPLSIEFSDALSIDERPADFRPYAMDPTQGVTVGGETIEGEAFDPDTGEVEPDPEPVRPVEQERAEKPVPKTSAPAGRAPKPSAAEQYEEPDYGQAGLPLGDPEQQTASGPSLDEIEARWQSKLRQMHADFESSGADAVLDLWADHLEKLKDEAPHLHAALMADLGLTTG
jgi:recombination protein RecT